MIEKEKVLSEEELIKIINMHVDIVNFNMSLIRVGLNAVQAVDEQLLSIEELLGELFELRRRKKKIVSLES